MRLFVGVISLVTALHRRALRRTLRRALGCTLSCQLCVTRWHSDWVGGRPAPSACLRKASRLELSLPWLCLLLVVYIGVYSPFGRA